jgi:hypothetical protein
MIRSSFISVLGCFMAGCANEALQSAQKYGSLSWKQSDPSQAEVEFIGPTQSSSVILPHYTDSGSKSAPFFEFTPKPVLPQADPLLKRKDVSIRPSSISSIPMSPQTKPKGRPSSTPVSEIVPGASVTAAVADASVTAPGSGTSVTGPITSVPSSRTHASSMSSSLRTSSRISSSEETEPEAELVPHSPLVVIVGPAILVDRETVADQIGAYVVGITDDWSRFGVHMASLFARTETRAWPEQVSLADADDFWRRANGDALLSRASSENTCAPLIPYDTREFDGCDAVMMLISNMPLPNKPEEAAQFMQSHLLLNFITTHSEFLRTRLSESERQLYNVDVPFLLAGEIDEPKYSYIRGFAINWPERFPVLFENHIQAIVYVVKHAFNRIGADPTRYGGSRGYSLYPVMGIIVARSNALESSTRELEGYLPSAFRKGFRSVIYDGEISGGGGLTMEWFALIDASINGVVFKTRPGGLGFEQIDADMNVISFNNFKFIGKFFSLCIIHNRPTSLQLPIAFFKLMLGGIHAPTLEDIRDIDEETYNGVRHFANPNLTQDEFDSFFLGEDPLPLPGSGTSEPVSLSNRFEQINMVITNVITNNNRASFKKISEGFFEIIPRELFHVNPEQFKKLICANREINVEDFINHMDFRYTWLRDREEWFKRIVRSFSQERLSKLLRFITGYNVLPNGGFDAFESRISIGAHDCESTPLPKAHTCYKAMDMPQYATFEECERILTNVVDFANFAEMSERG